jgi:hypothetical protein
VFEDSDRESIWTEERWNDCRSEKTE